MITPLIEESEEKRLLSAQYHSFRNIIFDKLKKAFHVICLLNKKKTQQQQPTRMVNLVQHIFIKLFFSMILAKVDYYFII